MKRQLGTLVAMVALTVAGGAKTPYFTGDVQEFLDKACAADKRVLVSLGREKCGRCQKFYALLDGGSLVLDDAKCMYLKMNVDEVEHHEYFSSWFYPMDPRLPFVGVLDPNACTGTCITAACDIERLKGLLGDMAKVRPPAKRPETGTVCTQSSCAAPKCPSQGCIKTSR